jgi:hypothetical protein
MERRRYPRPVLLEFLLWLARGPSGVGTTADCRGPSPITGVGSHHHVLVELVKERLRPRRDFELTTAVSPSYQRRQLSRDAVPCSGGPGSRDGDWRSVEDGLSELALVRAMLGSPIEASACLLDDLRERLDEPRVRGLLEHRDANRVRVVADDHSLPEEQPGYVRRPL